MLSIPQWAELACSTLETTAQRCGFELEAYCVMPEHIHVLAAGAAEHDSDLAAFVRLFKQVVGFQYKRATGESLWHRSYFDHILRPDESHAAHAAYILNNPVKAELVADAAAWPYSGPRDMERNVGSLSYSSAAFEVLEAEIAVVGSR